MKNKYFPFLALIFLLLGNVSAQDTEHEDKSWKRFQIEITGGLASVNPSDLNLRADYDRQYLVRQKEYYSYYFPAVEQGVGVSDFRKIKSTFPFGFRFKYRISRAFSLSLGFKYFSKSETSEANARFHDMSTQSYSLDFSYSPYTLSISGFAPLLGVHFLIKTMNFLDFELFLSGGPLFAKCRYLIGDTRLYSRSNSVYRAQETSYEIDGKSTGISLNTGARIYAGIIGNLKFFCEGGYSYQKAKNLQGQGKFIYYRYVDPSRKEIFGESDWEGFWGIKETQEYAPLPSNEWEKNDQRVSDFNLDLSGLFFHIGFSFDFSL